MRGGECEVCGVVPYRIEVHHKHYNTLGRENPSDLILLCPECHRVEDEKRIEKNAREREVESELRMRESAFNTWMTNRTGYDAAYATEDDYLEFSNWYDNR